VSHHYIFNSQLFISPTSMVPFILLTLVLQFLFLFITQMESLLQIEF